MLSAEVARAEPLQSSAGARFVVLVDYGPRALADAKRRIAPLAASYAATVIAVDTSGPLRLRAGGAVNDAFEFSGYQYGLERALDSAAPERSLTIAFVNGTALTSHVPGMVRRCLSRAFRAARPNEGPRRFDGFRHRCSDSRRAVATLGYYVATFAFWISGPRADLSTVSLYDEGAVGPAALAGRYAFAGSRYAAAIDAWLCPSSLWRGWYKAIPGSKVDLSTLYRKRLAIYLEHSLPAWLCAQGFAPAAPGQVSVAANDALMLLDKAFVNLLKARYRIGHVITKRLSAR